METKANKVLPTLRLVSNMPASSGLFVTDSIKSADLFRQSFDPGEIGVQEYFKVMFLKSNMEVIGIQTISMGAKQTVVVDNKVFFASALLANADCLILCHNHPSGSLKESPEDIGLTKKIQQAAGLLDIVLLDHIILAESGYTSLADNGVVYNPRNNLYNIINQ